VKNRDSRQVAKRVKIFKDKAKTDCFAAGKAVLISLLFVKTSTA